MCAARNEGDIGASLGQCRAEPAPDAARADYRNPHPASPQTLSCDRIDVIQAAL
jgi:hypothetical protein